LTEKKKRNKSPTPTISVEENSLHVLTSYMKYSHEMQMGKIVFHQCTQFCALEGAIVEVRK